MFTEPVTAKDFFDRQYFLTTLIKRAKGLGDGYRQNIAIFGPEYIGKTSLILQFILQIRELPLNGLPVYLEVTNSIPFTHLVKRFLATVIFDFLKNRGLNPPEDLNELINNSRTIIPRTIEAIDKCLALLEKNRYDDIYSSMLDVPSVLSGETGMPVILILEEFHNFSKTPVKNPFGILSKKIMLQKSIMYVISSSQFTIARKILSRDLTFLFGNFEVLTLDNFDIKASEDLINKKLLNIKCSSDYRQFIVELTNGNPLYLNVISSEISTLAQRSNSKFVTDKVIVDALLNLIFSSEGILNQLFNHRLGQLPVNRSPISYSSILLALGHGFSKARQMIDYLKIKSEKDFSNHLNRLLELDYVQRSGFFYHLHDKLFKIWLSHVYEARISGLEVDSSTKKERFKEAMQTELSNFLVDKRKDLIERITELISSFNNEIIYLNSKKIILPPLKVAEIKNSQNETPLLICKTGNKPWVFAVRKNCVHESAIEDVISGCSKLKDYSQRKILIALGGIDTDAKLIAKEAGFLTLEPDELNKLLGLFGKSKIFS